MTRANANIARIMICPFDIQGKTMSAADKAEWLVSLCSIKTGLSGYLDPGVPMCILE